MSDGIIAGRCYRGPAASYLTRNAPHVSVQSATVHGDIVAFVVLAILFAVGAVVTVAVPQAVRRPRTQLILTGRGFSVRA